MVAGSRDDRVLALEDRVVASAHRLLPLVLSLCVLVQASAVPASEPTAAAPALPKDWKFALPTGDATAGKEAVRTMQCWSCHRFPAGEFPEARSSGGLGPDLGPAYSKLPREFLAESIIDSHKYIAGTLDTYRGLDKISSKMGDYSGIMTVRQLIDIVEFLKQPEGK